jgi:ribosome biogenesis GTPase
MFVSEDAAMRRHRARPFAARAPSPTRMIDMLEFKQDALAALGLSPALAARARGMEHQADQADEDPLRLGRVTEVHRESVIVDDGVMAHGARASPRLLRALQDDGDALAVGDWVLASVAANGQCWLTARVPPVSAITRRDSDGRSHRVVSNVDVAFLVMGLDDDFNPRRLERFLALVWDPSIVKVVVLTKADVIDSRVVDERRALLRERLPAVAIVPVDATDATAATALTPWLDGGATLVMLGSSGAGKSTLTNTLLGAAVQDTGLVRAHDSRGKHTTTARSLHRVPGGGCIIDTPGLRTLRPDADEAALAASFSDIDALAARCRFRDCGHAAEPGCAVRDGIGADRLRNYHKLLRELRRDTLTPLDRQKQLAHWKVRGKASKERMRQKRAGTLG